MTGKINLLNFWFHVTLLVSLKFTFLYVCGHNYVGISLSMSLHEYLHVSGHTCVGILLLLSLHKYSYLGIPMWQFCFW